LIAYLGDHDLDYRALAALYDRVGWGERAEDPRRLEAMIRGSLWVMSAWDGPRAIGFARAISDGVTNGYVTDVMVDPDHRRAGIAGELVRRLLLGKDEIHFVLRAEPEFHPLYERQGFVPAPTMLRRRRAR